MTMIVDLSDTEVADLVLLGRALVKEAAAQDTSIAMSDQLDKEYFGCWAVTLS